VVGTVLAVVLIALGGFAAVQLSRVEPDPPGDVPSSGGSDANPGSAEPAPSAPPAPTAGTDPPAHPKGVAVAGYEQLGPTSLRLHYYIGVPECYGKVTSVDVRESAQRVEVLLVRTPPKHTARVACIEIALANAVTVTLEAPLGDRAVVDLTTGAEVPRSSLP
jgi:hypothetical protein